MVGRRCRCATGLSTWPGQTWATVGIQGLAPQWFEVQATLYVGESATTLARFEAEYELLITNRLVLQPLVELNLYGKSIPERGIGAGLSAAETGLRLRYEVRRESRRMSALCGIESSAAPLIFPREAGHDIGGWRLAAGLTNLVLGFSKGATMMRRFILLLRLQRVLTTALAGVAVAHPGHEHKIMGTVTMAAADHVMLKDKDGKDATSHQ